MGDGGDWAIGGSSRFELRRELGRGGMGVVYEAFDRETDSIVALKTLMRRDGHSLYRLKNEFRALQQMRHPNLVQLHELFEVNGQWFFTMELIPGTDLLSYVRGTETGVDVHASTLNLGRTWRDGEARLRAVLRQLAQGLAAVHDSGRVHRDVKPSNVRVTPEGRVVLMDFGLVTSLQPDDQSRDGSVVGTAAYMAPEQAGEAEVGAPADWYAVGVVLYEALTGFLPFDGAPMQVMATKLRAGPPPVRERAANAPPDLAALCDALLRTNAGERPRSSEILRRLGAVGPLTVQHARSTGIEVPFVGRVRELAALQAAYQESRTGRSVVVEVSGESGVGKTALVRALTERVQSMAADCVILAGRCHEQESVPYKGVDGVVDSLARYLRALSDVEAALLVPRHVGPLRQMFPVLERVMAIARAPATRTPIDPHELRYRAFDGLRELLERLGQRRPVVAVIDDMQWADFDSLRLLEHLTGGDEAPSILLVTVARPSGRDADEPYVPGARRIALDRLAPTEARRLARVLLDVAGAQNASPAHVAVAGAGHPLYIAEVARHVSKGSGTKAPRLDDAIWGRVKGLPADARHLVELIAVLGVPMNIKVLRESTGFDVESVRRAMGLLRAVSLVRMTAGDGTEVEAYHDRVREAVVARLDPATVLERRQQLARGLQISGVGKAHPELLVAQLEAVGERALAARLAIEASTRAMEALAFDRAASLLEIALRNGDFARDEKANHVCARAEALASAGRPLEAAEQFLVAADLTSSAQAVRLRSRAGAQFLRGGSVDDGLETLADVLAAIGVVFPRTEKGLLWRIVRDRLRLRVRGIRVPQHPASNVGPKRRLYLDTLAELSAGLGMFDALLASYFQNLHLLATLRRGTAEDLVLSLAYEALYASATHRFGHAERCLGVLRRMAGAPEPLRTLFVSGVEVSLLFQQNQWKAARKSADAAIAEIRSRPLGWWHEVATVQTHCLWAVFYEGDFAELRARQRDAMRDSQGRGDAFNRGMLSLGLCNAAWLVDDLPTAAGLAADEAIEPWRHLEKRFPAYWYWVAKVNTELYLGDVDRAVESGTELSDMPRWMLGVPMVRSERKHVIGRAALSRAVITKAESDLRLVDRMVRQLSRDKIPVASVFAILLRGTARAVRGDVERARADLEIGSKRAAAADMRGFESAARRALGLLLGGDEGAAMVRAADNALMERGIRKPAQFARMLVPAVGAL